MCAVKKAAGTLLASTSSSQFPIESTSYTAFDEVLVQYFDAFKIQDYRFAKARKGKSQILVTPGSGFISDFWVRGARIGLPTPTSGSFRVLVVGKSQNTRHPANAPA